MIVKIIENVFYEIKISNEKHTLAFESYFKNKSLTSASERTLLKI